jgi:hypothetical protein
VLARAKILGRGMKPALSDSIQIPIGKTECGSNPNTEKLNYMKLGLNYEIDFPSFNNYP